MDWLHPAQIKKTTSHVEQFSGTLRCQLALTAHGPPCGQNKKEQGEMASFPPEAKLHLSQKVSFSLNLP